MYGPCKDMMYMITMALMVSEVTFIYDSCFTSQICLVEECILHHGSCVLDGGMLEDEVLVRQSFNC